MIKLSTYSASSLFSIKSRPRDWTHLNVARSSDYDGAYVILLKTTEISRHSSSLDSFFDLLGDVPFN